MLITAPSLDPGRNVNGISAVVMTIIGRAPHEFFHYRLGRDSQGARRSGWLGDLFRQLLRFPGFVRAQCIDLVHQNLPLDAKGILREWVVSRMCRALRVPVLLHVHGGAYLMSGCPNAFLRMLARQMLCDSSVVVVLSEREKDALAQNYRFRDAEVLPNAVEVPAQPRHRMPMAGGVPTLLFLGRIHESKGVEDLVDAIAILYPRRRFRFVVCGAGPLEGLLLGRCRAVMGDDFSFLGVVAGADKDAVIERADLFLLPSRYGEGLPMALLETMARGVVPVVTDDASMRIVVTPGVNGLRVQKANAQDIADQIERVLADETRMARLSHAAWQSVATHYGLDAYIERLEALYRRCTRPCGAA